MNGEPIQVSVWLKRSKNGVRYLRIHVEPPYEAPEGDSGAGDQAGMAEDLPF